MAFIVHSKTFVLHTVWAENDAKDTLNNPYISINDCVTVTRSDLFLFLSHYIGIQKWFSYLQNSKIVMISKDDMIMK